MTEMEAPKIMEFEMPVGTHYEPDLTKTDCNPIDRNTRYVGPCIIKASRDLEEQFPNKFKKVRPGQTPVIVTEQRKQEVSQLIATGNWTEEDRQSLETMPEVTFVKIAKRELVKIMAEDKVISPLGEDVTHKFQQAYDNSFLVFRNPAGKHQVTKRGVSGKALNIKGPLEEDQVEEFIAEYLKRGK